MTDELVIHSDVLSSMQTLNLSRNDLRALPTGMTSSLIKLNSFDVSGNANLGQMVQHHPSRPFGSSHYSDEAVCIQSIPFTPRTPTPLASFDRQLISCVSSGVEVAALQ